MRFGNVLCVLLSLVVLSPVSCGSDEEQRAAKVASRPADLLLINGYVYTANPDRTVAEAVAVNDGVISAVGSTVDLRALQGPKTQVIDLAGRMLMPGLQDAHLHLLGMAEPDICTLRDEPMSLQKMVPYLQDCIRRYELQPGDWLAVDRWNCYLGNDVSAGLGSLRAALDAVSTEHPVILWGIDGHHGAVNSRALERARDPSGNQVGLSKQTMGTVFAEYADLVGLDANGDPNGEVNEQARYLMAPPPRRDPAVRGPLLPQVGELLARNGITSVQEAAMEPSFLPYFKTFAESGRMRFRMQAALYLDPFYYRDPLSGEVRLDDMMNDIETLRAGFIDVPLVRLNAAKIYVDGVLEGNPIIDPPTLPNAAVLEAYHQPLYRRDAADGTFKVIGYVDTSSPACQEVRAEAEKYHQASAVRAFRAEQGFHPAQCMISNGVLRDSASFIDRYVRRLDEAGFTIHMHVIGDRAARVAVDALAHVITPGGGNPLRHSLAHLQLVHPDDQKRIGELGLYLAWTYAWAATDPRYDINVMPFLGDVNGPRGMYDPESYWIKNSYPVRRTMEFGAIPVAGSDAPVDDRSPRPFVNMALGLTRRGRDGNVLNAEQAIDIHQMIAAYTINGARALNQEKITGSIEVGKKADLAVLDRNIVDLYESGHADDIAKTQVDMTLFDGQIIYVKD